MLNLQFNGVGLNALADISKDGRHIQRVLSFADGHQKVLGCILGAEGTEVVIDITYSSERIEIIAGDCEIAEGAGERNYYREGQSLVVAQGTKLSITTEGVLQYIRHLEG